MIYQRKTSLFILFLLFTFDNIWSYIAVSKFGLKELNLVIAPLVERYPWLYFLCIPLQIIMIFAIGKAISFLAFHVLKKRFTRKVLEEITFFSLCIYWAIANSLVNFLAIFFHHLPAITWGICTVIGVALAVGYAIFCLKQKAKRFS